MRRSRVEVRPRTKGGRTRIEYTVEEQANVYVFALAFFFGHLSSKAGVAVQGLVDVLARDLEAELSAVALDKLTLSRYHLHQRGAPQIDDQALQEPV